MNNGSAEYIIKGGTFFRGKGLPNDIDFMAVKSGRILGMGKEKDMTGYIGSETEVETVSPDCLVMPGFYDSHNHTVMAGMYHTCVDLGDCESEEGTCEKVKKYAETIPGELWVYGFNWYHVFWENKVLPTTKIIDRYVSDRPVFLVSAEGHTVWLNSRALELCGITRDTEAPPYGKIYRFDDGTPSGCLDDKAIDIAADYACRFPESVETRFIREHVKKSNYYGITSINDFLPFYGFDMGNHDIFKKLEERGELSLRVHCAPDLFSDIDEVLSRREKYNSGRFRICMLKAFVDGVWTMHTALMLEPYANKPDSRGRPACDLDLLKDRIEEAHRKGISVRLHCCGDGASHYALDCIEGAVKKYGQTGARHAIEHFETTIMEDIARCASLGVIASIQPAHIAMIDVFDENTYLGAYNERQKKMSWAIGSFMDAGVTVVFGSDCPIVSSDPFLALYRAVTRLHNDGRPEGGWNPEQKISMEDALDAYTLKGAFAVGREDELGTLETGKLADFIVLDRNLLTIGAEEIRGTKVLKTFVEGKCVYAREQE